ncbi:hypothetical protein T03_13095 [Trichinella britovi]|uniref:Uncharacterized protein n=1 Tax=Trichinella britovi TaxID=45882 RepID=A0A0V1CAB1_TRIBR|nr:hypothetical protein T03_13095 [Trichinella britovi]
MDAYWTYVMSRLTFQLTISKFHSIEQSTEEYNCTLDADQALLSMETSTDFVRTPDDAVVSACHRCACCTQSKGLRGNL